MASTPQTTIPRFDSEFLERRMQAHREQQRIKTEDELSSIIREVAAALALIQHETHSRKQLTRSMAREVRQ